MPENDLRPEDDDYALWCELNLDEDQDENMICRHCGKDFHEFADLGCEYCDQRHPGFGTMD